MTIPPILIALLVGVGFSNDAKAQMEKVSGDEYQYQDILEFPVMTAKEIYDRAVEWTAFEYLNTSEIPAILDPDNHVIVANGTYKGIRHALMNNWTSRHMLKIEVKEERLRLTMHRFTVQGPDAGAPELLLAEVFGEQRMVKKVEALVVEHIASLADAMSQPADSDW